MGGGSSSLSATEKPLCVIVGAGSAGRVVAKTLQKDGAVRVFLVDKRNYSQHNIGLLRSIAEQDWGAMCALPLDQLLKEPNHVVCGDVSEITASNVTGSDGRSSTFDYLVLATGAMNRYPAAANINDAVTLVEKLEASRKQVAAAKKILVIGGGSVGCELVGELKYSYPECEVTLVHGGEKLVHGGLLPTFHERTLKKLTKMGVKVVLKERAVIPEAAREDLNWVGLKETITMESGKTFSGDVVFLTTGLARVNDSAYAAAFGGSMERNGRLRVKSTQQVEGHKHIFAVGDCCLTPKGDWQMAFHAGEQAKVCAANITKLAKASAAEKKGEVKLTQGYGLSGKKALFLTLGPKNGVCQLPFGKGKLGPTMMVKAMKSKNLFTSDQWKQVNYAVPTSGAECPVKRRGSTNFDLALFANINLNNLSEVSEEQAAQLAAAAEAEVEDA